MRKIEQQMLKAVKDRRNWRSGNTAVQASIGQDGRVLRVLLHGNLIAVIGKSDKVYPHTRTIQRWPTPTTKSRLRALGVDVYTRNHVTYLNGEAI